jgi:hypothetical protein
VIDISRRSPFAMLALVMMSEDLSLSLLAVVGHEKALVKSVHDDPEYLRNLIVGAVPEATVPRRT